MNRYWLKVSDCHITPDGEWVEYKEVAKLQAELDTLKDDLIEIKKYAYKAHCDPQADNHVRMYGIVNMVDQALKGETK